MRKSASRCGARGAEIEPVEIREIASLPSSPLAASEAFFREHLAGVSGGLKTSKGDLAILLPPAQIDHDDWRRSLARDLAREFAPVRVNIVGGGDQAVREETLAYLRDAPGITGQYLALND